MIGEDSRFVRKVAIGILGLAASRLVFSISSPLLYDEAYYWLLSKNLDFGYYDHPPMVMFLIRLGTLVAGDTELGVRFCSVFVALAATWAIWRAAAILFGDARLAALAALYFNLTLATAGPFATMTSDGPVLAASAFLLFFLAKVIETGRGAWWLAVGATVGLGLLSKYTMLFLGAGIGLWLLIVPEMRRWLFSPWPWLGGFVAALLFAPAVYWNWQHDWASFLLQSGRGQWLAPRFPRDFIYGHVAGQIAFATPFIFALGMMGLAAFIGRRGKSRSAHVLIGVMFWPTTIYFLWESLNQRVLFHWTVPVFAAFAIAAATAHRMEWQGIWARVATVSRRLAIPVALAMMFAIGLNALYFLVPLGRGDIFAQQISPGRQQVVPEVEALRQRIGAATVITSDYRTTGWLAFYLPSRPPVIEITERIRWVNASEPSAALFAGPLLYVMDTRRDDTLIVRRLYAEVEEIARVSRREYGVELDTYIVYRVARPKGAPLDRGPPLPRIFGR